MNSFFLLFFWGTFWNNKCSPICQLGGQRRVKHRAELLPRVQSRKKCGLPPSPISQSTGTIRWTNILRQQTTPLQGLWNFQRKGWFLFFLGGGWWLALVGLGWVPLLFFLGWGGWLKIGNFCFMDGFKQDSWKTGKRISRCLAGGFSITAQLKGNPYKPSSVTVAGSGGKSNPLTFSDLVMSSICHLGPSIDGWKENTSKIRPSSLPCTSRPMHINSQDVGPPNIAKKIKARQVFPGDTCPQTPAEELPLYYSKAFGSSTNH